MELVSPSDWEDKKHPIRIEPIFLPLDEQSRAFVAMVVKRLRLPNSKGRGPSYEAMVASVIYSAQLAIERSTKEKLKPRRKQRKVLVGTPTGNDNWTDYPLVGASTGRRTLNAFEEHGLLIKEPETGKREFYTTFNGKLAYDGVMTQWRLSPSFVKQLDGIRLSFVEAGMPLLKINKVETRSERELRKKQNGTKQKLSRKSIEADFGQDTIDAHEQRIKSLCKFWMEHPLVLPNGNAAASATRIFSDSRLDVGGRLYGAWTNMKSKDRLMCTIDGEALVQLDISASQPTLLSILLGIPLQTLGQDGVWYDPYTELTQLWSYGIPSDWKANDLDGLRNRARGIAKAIIVEMVGTGNVNKTKPSKAVIEEFNVTQEEWDYFSAKLVQAIPALSKLEHRFDRNGHPTGYINGPAFLAYHESEIMLETLEVLRDGPSVVAYPVHDCLLVKVSDWELAYTVFVETISSYVERMNGSQVVVPIQREGGGLLTKRFRGRYNTSQPQHLIP